MVFVMLEGIEIYGFGRFNMPYYVDLKNNNCFCGRNSSGKTVFLKCLNFFLDCNGYIEDYYISNESAYVKGYFRENEYQQSWILKKITSKGKNVKFENVYSENLSVNILKWYETINPIYFNSEKTYTNKDDNIKDLEKKINAKIQDDIQDVLLILEDRFNEKVKENGDDYHIDIEGKIDFNKTFQINVKYNNYLSYLSSSERKMILLDTLIKSNDNNYFLLDDLDVYLDGDMIEDIINALEFNKIPYVAIFRNNYKFVTGFIDFTYNQDQMNLVNYFHIVNDR